MRTPKSRRAPSTLHIRAHIHTHGHTKKAARVFAHFPIKRRRDTRGQAARSTPARDLGLPAPTLALVPCETAIPRGRSSRVLSFKPDHLTGCMDRVRNQVSMRWRTCARPSKGVCAKTREPLDDCYTSESGFRCLSEMLRERDTTSLGWIIR